LPPFLSTDAVVHHMATFGRVVCTSRGTLFPHTLDGMLHLTMQLDDPDRLPAYLQLVDEGGHLAASLAVHTDCRRRHCYKCGGNHVAMWYRAAQRPAGTWHPAVDAAPTTGPTAPLQPVVASAVAPAAPPADQATPPPLQSPSTYHSDLLSTSFTFKRPSSGSAESEAVTLPPGDPTTAGPVPGPTSGPVAQNAVPRQ
jgi:hypothetical protein